MKQESKSLGYCIDYETLSNIAVHNFIKNGSNKISTAILIKQKKIYIVHWIRQVVTFKNERVFFAHIDNSN